MPTPDDSRTFGSGVLGRTPVPQPGTRFGAFEIEGTLGRGSMGVVLAARDSLGREVALKLLNQANPTERALERFQREGEVMASLRHPGIVTVHEAGLVNGCPFLSCGRVDGRDLDEVLLEGEQREVLLDLLREIADAVGYAHQQGVVHRDLKPANVLVDREGHAHVTDFGLAQAIGLERLTQSGMLVGTPSYMAPEQVTATRDAYGPHTDTWALGVLLYRILTGAEPFPADTLSELTVTILRRDPQPPRSLDATISKDLEAVCLKALSKAPQDRYVDAVAFAADLTRGQSGERPLAQTARRRRLTPLLAVGVIGLVGLAIAALPGQRAEPEAAEASPTATPTADVDSPQDALLRQELEQALEHLLRGEPTRAADGLRVVDRLAPKLRSDARFHPRLRRAQAALVAKLMATLEAQGSLATLKPTLEGLATLRKALPAAAPRLLGAPAANAVVRACTRAFRATHLLALDTLEALERCGVRSDDPIVATDLFEAFVGVFGARRDRPAIMAGRRLFLVCARLDVGTGGYRATRPRLFRRFSPEGSGPWETYAQARCSSDKAKSRRTLLRLLQNPPTGFDLGPIHWAESARHIAPFLGPKKTLEILLEAARRDPRSCYVQATLALALTSANRPKEALAASDRSFALFVKLGFHERSTLRNEWESILVHRATTLASCDERARARQVYRRLKKAFPVGDADGIGKVLITKYPWLIE